MAFSSISRMSVPTASDGSSSPQGLLMPKLSYRFRILFENLGVSGNTTELTKQVVDFTRPKVNFPEISLPIYNSTVYLAGKPAWDPVTVNIRDDATGEVARLVGEQIQKQFDFSEQASAASGTDYKFKIVCQILDGARGVSTPNILESWELYGCYIVNADYGTLNYGDNNALQIALQIRFDNAVQTPLDGQGPAYGIGAAIGRTIGTNVSGIGSPGTPQG
jgi:hypothetical protein